MAHEERRVNWGLVIGGVILVLFGVCAYIAPWLFLEFITIWAGAGFLISGVSGIATYFQIRRSFAGAGWTLFMAILDILVGAMLMLHPFAFAPVLPWMLGAAFIVFGAVEVGGLVPFGQFIPESRPVMIISGVLTVVIGIMFLVWPESLSIWVAAFALIRGVTLIVTGATVRS